MGWPTADALKDAYCRLGMLRRRDDGRQRYRTYACEGYLTILRDGADPP